MAMTAAEKSRRYRERHPDRWKRSVKKWNEANPEKRHLIRVNNGLKRKYGITLEQYEKLLADQGGVCAVCGGPHVGVGGRYHVDHDHRTGVVRGLLCGTCNTGLGQFKDDPVVLEKAISYLKKHGK